MTDAPAPIGRPSKYDPAYCDSIVEHMRDGASILSFAAEIGVGRSTIQEWEKEHPAFSVAVTRAKAVCAAWWEKQGRKLAQDGGGNGQSTMVIFGLKNMGRDEWSESIKHVGGDPASGDKPIQAQVSVNGLSEAALAALADVKLDGE